MNSRGKWQGMLTVARLNWLFSLVACIALVASVAIFVLTSTTLFRIASGVAFMGAGYFLFVSLGVSHLIYDRSDLYKWQWLSRALQGTNRGEFVFCHSGFDEASISLHKKLGDVGWTVLDHFDALQMTERSIRNARNLFPPTPETLPATYDRWPVADQSTDVIFGMLAIHELRSEAQRTAWFGEAGRCLRAGGRIILVEHLRNLENFLAFGPGFLHFHSSASWRRCWMQAGLVKKDEFRITPWVGVFILGLS